MVQIAVLAVLLAVLLRSSEGFNQAQPPSARLSTRCQSSVQSSPRLALSMRWGLKTKDGLVANKPTGDLADGVSLRDTVPFELRGFSLPLVVFSVGAALTATSFAGFFSDGGGDGGAVSSLGFVYGIPVFLIGLSLWYAEIQPAVVVTDEAGDAAWEKFSTETFRQIKQDVTRHRYGDDAHLDSTLESLGLKLPQKKFPKLQTIKQEAINADDGEQLRFTLVFQSVETPFKTWNDPERVRRYSKFFGPNVLAEVEKTDAEERIVSLKLTTCSDDVFAALLASPIPEKITKSVSTSEKPVTIEDEGAAKVGTI